MHGMDYLFYIIELKLGIQVFQVSGPGQASPATMPLTINWKSLLASVCLWERSYWPPPNAGRSGEGTWVGAKFHSINRVLLPSKLWGMEDCG